MLAKYYYGGQVKENEIDGARDMSRGVGGNCLRRFGKECCSNGTT